MTARFFPAAKRPLKMRLLYEPLLCAKQKLSLSRTRSTQRVEAG